MKKNIVAAAIIVIIAIAAAAGLLIKQNSRTGSVASRQAKKSVPARTYRVNGRTTYVYAKESVLTGKKKVPLVLFMNGTGGDPQKQAVGSGWAKKAMSGKMIVISPKYDDASTYTEVPYIVKVVKKALRIYPVDSRRVYSLGFSNGGATSVALTSTHPDMFAGIAMYGWAVDLERQSDYDMPFQVIEGTGEATEYTVKKNPMVRVDVRHAIKELFTLNGMKQARITADYARTPYWGYVPDSSYKRRVDGKNWTINNYQKTGYSAPFAQLIMISKADHRVHASEADYSWNFLKHFSRDSQGKIIEQ
ncbi:hypothetical protein lacNasYZ03_00320 [Lactobacillus nasalidis]|uniref:Peptidase S9 prolyl oligopeptidase catalytic domain-containing protein n=1 Tax=Lactobacillus nasalidis TaxID=2797258 RepID=A0ABQ3W4U4_9LACO|nr:prolyl oligopeptidase family serine peptidase [Lactobacillus nasalidis]GHV98518.1 hypothetical protein lacNasYZ01_17000 [Lactobacillus nasalidis]GHW00013.1 hypothetical protein lacNasYZ02_14420 [Lactobacillus nasalidis]GHW00345.1 hypothetical protein lacNasYZ03_00320 [Lactobacillus nasalidis]